VTIDIEFGLFRFFLNGDGKYFDDVSVQAVYFFDFIESFRCKIIGSKFRLLFLFLLFFHLFQLLLMFAFIRILNILILSERSINNS